MDYAKPQTLAELLRRDRDDLLATWEARARRLPGADQLPSAYLRDHLPPLLDELASELEQPESARERLQAFSAAHGQHRHELGVHLPLVVDEYKTLRRCIIEHAEARGLMPTGDALRIVGELIDDGVKAAIAGYIERRDAAEKQRREDYLRFIVHDLRSPLAAIYYAILLAERELQHLEGGERVRTIHAAIKRNIEQMRALIAKLLQEERNVKTPRRVELQRETVALWPIVESAVRTLAPIAANAGTRLDNAVPRDLTVYADAELLDRIIQNLVANAIEYTPAGRVSIGASAAADGTVECWVADDGRGIPEDLRATVFDKFTTDSQRPSGVGLGLAIVKQLVEAHGGTIALHSRPGEGTTIRFSIPGE